MALTARMVTMDCADPAGEGMLLDLRRVGEPENSKNRVHMDGEVADRVAEATRLTPPGLGTVAEHEVGGVVWTVLADPEGDGFRVAGRD